MTRSGMGARMEAQFKQKIFWGCEFLSHRVRLCGVQNKNGVPTLAETFEGSYAEAEIFAESRGLLSLGFNASVSHLPFKISRVHHSESSSEETLTTETEGALPIGLKLDAMELVPFQFGAPEFMVLLRSDTLHSFLDSLPRSLKSFWTLTPSPLVILPQLMLDMLPGNAAVIQSELHYSHILFFKNQKLESYVKIFAGLEQTANHPETYLKELKKVLVYYYSNRFSGSTLDSVHLINDGEGNAVKVLLTQLDISTTDLKFLTEIPTLPRSFQIAAALALQGLNGNESLAPFALGRPHLPQLNHKWKRRSGALAKYGSVLSLGAAIGVVLLVLSAFGLTLMVESKTHTWAGELGRWDEFQKRKKEVGQVLESMQGILAHKTESYGDLQRVAQMLPPETWLQSIELTHQIASGYTHHLSGYTLQESRVPQFLSNLEKSHHFVSVKLKSTEKIKGEVVEQKTGISANRKDLIHFEIGMTE